MTNPPIRVIGMRYVGKPGSWTEAEYASAEFVVHNGTVIVAHPSQAPCYLDGEEWKRIELHDVRA